MQAGDTWTDPQTGGTMSVIGSYWRRAKRDADAKALGERGFAGRIARTASLGADLESTDGSFLFYVSVPVPDVAEALRIMGGM